MRRANVVPYVAGRPFGRQRNDVVNRADLIRDLADPRVDDVGVDCAVAVAATFHLALPIVTLEYSKSRHAAVARCFELLRPSAVSTSGAACRDFYRRPEERLEHVDSEVRPCLDQL